MLVYVSGPYSAETQEQIEANVKYAAEVAAALWAMGHAVICPHTNSHLVSQQRPAADLTHGDWIRGDLQMLARCDAVVLLPGWATSKGAVAELAYAEGLGIPIYDCDKNMGCLPDLHPTELRCPKQSRAFAEEIGRMYRTHLDKNADYSPANVLATGEIGLVTRLWDKVARLMNLFGFRFSVDPESVRFDGARSPKNESIDDTLRDAAVYSVIGLLLRRGQWGL